MPVEPDASKSQPRAGEGGEGETMDPTKLPKTPRRKRDEPPRAAPAPGLPISAEEYERMKKSAESDSPSSDESAQEDSTR